MAVPQTIKGCWHKNQGPSPALSNRHSDLPHRLRGCARFPGASSALAVLRLVRGREVGNQLASAGEGKRNTEDFCCHSCFQVIHVHFPCPGFLRHRFGGVWPLVKRAVCQKRPGCLLGLLGGTQSVVSGHDCQVLFPSSFLVIRSQGCPLTL